MKKILFALCVVACSVGCIDDDYDLTRIDSSDITIGTEESRFVIPLATIYVGMAELQNNGADIQAIFDEVEIWTPTTLPGNATYVDMVKLTDGSEYLDLLLSSLIDEMLQPESKKLDEIVDLIWDTPAYRDYFSSELPTAGEETFKTTFKLSFGKDDQVGEALREGSRTLAREYLFSIQLEPVYYQAALNLSGDVISMLTDNLDDESMADPKNALYLYGEVMCDLAVSFQVSVLFESAGVTVPAFDIERNVETDIPKTRFFAEEAVRMIDDFRVRVDYLPLRYYPGIGFQPGQNIRMALRLEKTGSLTFK